MVPHLVGFCVSIALPLGGGDVHKHGALTAMGFLERAHQLTNVMTVNRPHVRESQFFEDRPHLGDR